MCGIVGAVAQRNVAMILLEGLRRLEYRGYDSAGIAVIDSPNAGGQVQRLRTVGKVNQLAQALADSPVVGNTGIAHTRWATHGRPASHNAHPHMSQDAIALVHNGIIENYGALRAQLIEAGYVFQSETDTEVIVHLIHQQYEQTGDLLQAVRVAVGMLQGAFALGVIHKDEPGRLIAARCGSPLVIGLGIEEIFVASDRMALLPVAQRFVALHKGDVVDISATGFTIYGADGEVVERPEEVVNMHYDLAEKGDYRHYMQKEIFEQPQAIADTLASRLGDQQVYAQAFGEQAEGLFRQVERVQIVACGTSYHAGMLGRYWLEMLGVPCQVEVASEYRYRPAVVQPNALLVTLSQSGETADTLAALSKAKEQDYLGSLAICNVPDSLLVRESDMALMTLAGPEVGVASTKAFTTQLVGLLLLSAVLARGRSAEILRDLHRLPGVVEQMLGLDEAIKALAMHFSDKHHALFLGRGAFYPIAKEGALKIKEIAYIHAEAYPAGELKHGPLALIDETMPVVVLMPYDGMQEKMRSTLNEILARGGDLIVLADERIELAVEDAQRMRVLSLPAVDGVIAPIAYAVVLQLLAYHAAVLKGTDVDQPRNLAKAVTVE